MKKIVGEVMLTLGIDSGSTTTKAVVFDGTSIVRKEMVKTSANPKESMYFLYKTLMSKEVVYVVTTGYGRDLLEEANKTVTEITCHARGASFLEPNIGAIIDIGGQDSKVIVLDRDQNVVDFLMNDKCAAGTGRFVEVMSRILGKEIKELNEFVQGRNPIGISSMCTVFAESEIVSLLAKGENAGDIALGIIHSICKRTAVFAQKLPLEGHIFFSGGLSRIPIFYEVLGEYLNEPIKTSIDAQYAGAIGAAIIGWQKTTRIKKNR